MKTLPLTLQDLTFKQKVRLENINFALRHGIITTEEAATKILKLMKK